MKSKILIVDDQSGIRLLLTDVFTNEGYKVQTAKDGQEALEKIYQETFDLIMLDDHLPILTGRGLLKQLKEDQINIPVLMMSGLIEELQICLKKDPLVLAIIEKPFNIKEVCHLVSEILTDHFYQKHSQ